MKSINQLVYSIASIFAIVSACAALPINVASIDHANELIVGLLALTCISITILACTCCHRNKSGFEEFENENTVFDQTNSSSRSEFPIFRAISPPNTCHSLNNAENNLDNRILSNIVNQNHMNRTFNEFENSQNNNGPISVVDMENIQNNNAMEYIPNRNEINITIEPSPHSINRNLVMANDMADHHSVATTSMPMDRSMPATSSTSYDSSAGASTSFEPYYNLSNKFNAYLNDEMLPDFTGTATVSDSLNNYIDLDDDDATECPTVAVDRNSVERIHDMDSATKVALENAETEEDSCHRIDISNDTRIPNNRNNHLDIEHTKLDDDAISVEEALRALDFAISGGESVLFDYQDSSSSDNDVDDDDEDDNSDAEQNDGYVKCDTNEMIPSQHDIVSDKQQIDEDDDDDNRNLNINNYNHNDNDNSSTNVGNCRNDDGKGDGYGDGQRTNSELNAIPEMKCTGLIEIADAKDKLSIVKNDETNMNAEYSRNNVNSREYVYEIAKDLVDSVLKECTERITPMSNDNESTTTASNVPVTANSFVSESIDVGGVAPCANTSAASESIGVAAPSTMNPTNFNDTIDETFSIDKLNGFTASTPCHKSNVNFLSDQNRMGVNLFHTLNEVNESALSNSGIELLQKTDCETETETRIAYVTFQVQPNEHHLATTFVKSADDDSVSDDTTFVARATAAAAANELTNNLHDTFDVAVTCETKSQNQVPRINPTIKIDKEEANSDDLTTQTPMNTPIELNYLGESWDQFVSKSMNNKSIDLPATTTTTKCDAPSLSAENHNIIDASGAIAADAKQNAWFLHEPQINDTFDVNDDVTYTNYDGIDDDNESIEENAELLSLTFDALRKQLAESLPQASVRPSVDYSDDEDNVSDFDPDCDNLEYNTRFESPKSEVVINYKQQLSPILEESEEETCKTFVMNETKCLDSTSTGCIETSEAIMGVTKVLMASNDTLFNFEDTLGDREDMLSPRNASHSGTNTINSTTPQPDNCKTPTNEHYLAVYPVEYKPNDLNAFSDNHMINEIRPTTLQLNFENLTNNLGDLLSPEQQKTFSEEINTIEQVSSDLSATIDATNTLDDLKTCISVHTNDDMNSVKLTESDDIGVKQQTSSSLNKSLTSSINNGTHDANDDIESIDSPQTPTDINELQIETTTVTIANQNVDAVDIMYVKSSEYLKCDTANELIEPIECAKENKNPNLDFSINLIKADLKPILNKTIELNDLGTKIEMRPQTNEPNHLGALSGEEDPWAIHPSIHPIADIRFTGPRTENVMETMTETFTTNDWDSDIEDSNSSEEFVYAKGVSQLGEYLRSTQDIESHKHIDVEFDASIDKSPTNESSQETGDEQVDAHDIWNSHEDLIAVTTNADAESTDDVLDESSISENENEWVPSSWDSLAKPMRSALKSPDKSSSKSGAKNRRSVVFKKQSYQSVYEYPKESTSLSPTHNDRQGWATYLVNSSPFSSSVSDSYLMAQQDETSVNQSVDFNALNGFAVSSSSRPFHLSQFGVDCHTWPTETEFSWSQIQSDKELGKSDINKLADGWPINSESSVSGDASEPPKSPNSMHRPDSGVGESNELYSESLSLGDLCHTKSSLRLPLNVYTAEKGVIPAQLADDPNELSKSLSQNTDYSGENVVASDSMDSIVPTSCTGSMDSINSFDGGKSSQNHLNNSTNADGLLINTMVDGKCVSTETSVHNDITINSSKKCDYRQTANRQSDSTDEDSGIENIVRVTKEI